MSDKRTLGDFSTLELVESADREVEGLLEFLRGLPDLTDNQRITIGAYGGSIRSRLAIAKMRLHS